VRKKKSAFLNSNVLQSLRNWSDERVRSHWPVVGEAILHKRVAYLPKNIQLDVCACVCVQGRMTHDWHSTSRAHVLFL